MPSTSGPSRKGSQKRRPNKSDQEQQKDSTELELEKLVFGDEAGFRQQLEDNANASTGDDSEGDSDSEDVENAYLGDEDIVEDEVEDGGDVFFFDTGFSGYGNNASQEIAMTSMSDEDDAREASDSGPEPVWFDSDDEKVTISLATNPQLRKLRKHVNEDVISGAEYTKRLQKEFEMLYPTPDWAKFRPTKDRRQRSQQLTERGDDDNSMEGSTMDDDDDDSDADPLSAPPLSMLLRSANPLVAYPRSDGHRHKRVKLRPDALDIEQTNDVPVLRAAAIESLSFHPTKPLLLSSGPSATIDLHEVSPSADPPNPLLTSLHVRNTPLRTTVFDPISGHRIYFAGRRRFFHVWDAISGEITKITRIFGHQDSQKTMETLKPSPCGRWIALAGSSRKGVGIVNILDASSLRWVQEARVESHNGLGDFCWWTNGNGLCLVGKGGEVVEWSLEEEKAIAHWTDEGGTSITVVQLGGRSGQQSVGGDRWVAIGSASGITNVYDRREWKQGQIAERPKPTKSLTQLTTAISHLVFSPDAQILAMASRSKKDALRLVHLPSCSVFKNWPTSRTPLGRISAVAFSKESDMLAIGNDRGKIKLWTIRA